MKVLREVVVGYIEEFYFLESFPQHFHSSLRGNGYYNKATANSKCDPVPNLTLAHDNDWRNRVVENVTHTYFNQTGIVQIKIADSLYTQWDAHMDDSEVCPTCVDCTHWCFPGGVFPYIQRVVYNVIREDPRTKLFSMHLKNN
eukprot:gene24634-31002_t